jgi:hypothetical protein
MASQASVLLCMAHSLSTSLPNSRDNCSIRLREERDICRNKALMKEIDAHYWTIWLALLPLNMSHEERSIDVICHRKSPFACALRRRNGQLLSYSRTYSCNLPELWVNYKCMTLCFQVGESVEHCMIMRRGDMIEDSCGCSPMRAQAGVRTFNVNDDVVF